MKFFFSNQKKYFSAFFLVALIITTLLFTDHNVEAKVGVGMGQGEIRLTDKIKPGGIYNLPPIRIFNTGDEVTTYEMRVTYQQEYSEMRPDHSWFIFTPNTFTLEPTKSEEVKVSMVVPLKAEPGEYFAYLESGPVIENKTGTSVGVAVATKLFFTVVPANIWQAIIYRTSAFFATYSPWSWIALGIISLILLILVFRRFFSFSIGVKKKQ